jgi:hypothetical protein
MISTIGTRIWTPFGYKFAEDLYIGEKVISYNESRGVCEYDSILRIEMDYMQGPGLGIDSKSMRLTLTPDHPLMIWHGVTKEIRRIPIEDRFMRGSHKSLYILPWALFEPYMRTQEIEDIKWVARMLASYNHKRAPMVEESIISDLGGYEAQEFIDTFFHWNKMRRAQNWMCAVRLNSEYVRDIIFNIAPRAGLGSKRYYEKGSCNIAVTTPGKIRPNKVNWFRSEIDGMVFNITTKNGSVLARSTNGTFLTACNKESDVKAL